MNRLTQFLLSSIGRKFLVGITGVGLMGFVVTHLAGNLLLYVGDDAYDAYAHALHANPLLPVADFGLLGLFIVHIYVALALHFENKKARGAQGYYMVKSKQKIDTWPGSNMHVTGAVVLGFLLLHLIDMRFGLRDFGSFDSAAARAVAVLQNPLSFVVYIIGSLFLGRHLYHGFMSALRSLGVSHPQYTPLLEKLGKFFALAIGFGFLSLPLWAMFIR